MIFFCILPQCVTAENLSEKWLQFASNCFSKEIVAVEQTQISEEQNMQKSQV